MAHFNRFFNKLLFFKFSNKYQTEILGCASPSSHVCDFIYSIVIECKLCYAYKNWTIYKVIQFEDNLLLLSLQATKAFLEHS